MKMYVRHWKGRILGWMKYFICFCKVALSLSGAACCYMVVDYNVVNVLATYFTTEVFKEDAILKSAVFVNVMECVQELVVACMRANPKSSFGFKKIIILSTSFYILGLLMLYLTASNTIATTNFALFIFICAILAVGKRGGSSILERHLLDQLIVGHENLQHIDRERTYHRKNLWWFVAGAVVVVIPFRGEWPAKFLMSIYVIGAAGFISLGTSCFLFHQRQHPTTKTNLIHPETTPADDHDHQPSNQVRPNSASPAAAGAETTLKSPISSSVLEQEVNVPCCLLLRMIPMWSTFIVFSLVTSTADTFFNLQDDTMLARVESTNFLLAKDALKVVCGLFVKYSRRLNRRELNFFLKLIICSGMMLSVICPSLAWQVEVQRLNKAKEGEFEGQKVKMSDWCMTPLYVLWGVMEGVSMTGLDEFFNYHVSRSMEEQGSEVYNKLPIAMGRILSVACVSVCNGWLGNDLNSSRLDKYYWMITVLAWINLCWLFFVTTFYPTKEEEGHVEIQAELNEVLDNVEDVEIQAELNEVLQVIVVQEDNVVEVLQQPDNVDASKPVDS